MREEQQTGDDVSVMVSATGKANNGKTAPEGRWGRLLWAEFTHYSCLDDDTD